MSYSVKCECGLARTYGSVADAKKAVDKAHDRAGSDCPRNYKAYDRKGNEIPLRATKSKARVTGQMNRKPRVPKPKAEHPPGLSYCPNCGFNLEVLHMAVSAVRRLS